MILAVSITPPFLVQSVVIVVAAAVIAYISQRLGLVPIVGFLVAGVVIGPHALKLVEDLELVNAAAEVGVILLLFTIGIEFSLEKLARIKRLIFGGGTLQVLLTTLAVVGALAAFGVDWRAALFTGFLVSLSSTAIVLKLLADRDETATTRGQVTLGLLIFQDLAVVVMVLVVPMLGSGGGSRSDIIWALVRAVALILAVLLVARRLMPPVLERVALTCSPELFLLTVVAICLGTAWLSSIAGISLSLGAFLAGLIVSESRFSHHAFSEIMPLQILFTAMFFVSVGMLLDVSFLLRNLPLVVAAVAIVLLVKVLTTAGSVLALGYEGPVAAASAFTLAQVGEFSFVLERAGREVGLSPAGLGETGSQTFIASTVLLMVATPQLTNLGARLAEKLTRQQRRAAAEAAAARPDVSADTFRHLEHHVIVAGYGVAARQLVRVLHGSRVPFVITTLSPGGANEAETHGLPVLRGDSARAHTLELAGIERAKAVVVADDDPATALRIVAVARSLAPTARIIVRTRYQSDASALTVEGTDRVVVDELESVVQLFADVLRNYRISAEEIEAHEEAIRAGGYAALREASDRPVVECDIDGRCLDTRTVSVREGAQVIGMSPEYLASTFGLEVSAVERNGQSVDLRESTTFMPNDVVTIGGSAGAFASASPVFRTMSTGDVPPFVVDQATRIRQDIDTERPVSFTPNPQGPCSHLDHVRPVRPSARGCEDCLRMGDRWVHLRICLTCGHVGCCDSSKNKHATKHYHATGHPIVRSMERGEDWGWCYVDEVML
jgi:monovalent cation:H+ antiporter-2, CPA2 family